MRKYLLFVLLMTSLALLLLPQSRPENLASTLQPSGGSGQLISIEPLPDEGELCETPATAPFNLIAALQQDTGRGQVRTASSRNGRADVSERPPIRVIHDKYPAFSAVSVDPVRNEVAVTDENMFSIMVYDRLENTASGTAVSKPKRVITGRKTNIQFTCGVFMDPQTGEIYALNNDTQDKLVVFSHEAEGNVAPARMLQPPHAAFGIASDNDAGVFYLTIQHSHSVVVYRKGAAGNDDPIRLLQGNHTQMANPHGIAIDTKNKLMFVSNQGDSRTLLPPGNRPQETEDGNVEPAPAARKNWPTQRTENGSGHIEPSSITVYPLDAEGDTAPLRVIKGPKTLLDWPIGLAVDPDRQELYVANDVGDSVLVFRTEDDGDAVPIRMIQGPRTGIKNPTGLFLDRMNNELWVASFGKHSLTVFRPTADGDVAPMRTIRSAPADEPSLMISNPGALAYDTKREQLLVAN